MNSTPVAAYGRYSQITIVRQDREASTPREYGETFYVLLDRNNQRIGRTFHYLANARKQAAAMARHLSAGNDVALGVLGLTAEGLAR